MTAKSQTLRIKPSKIPLLFSFENLVLIVFLALTINFGVFFRISIFEIILIVFLIVVILLPVLGKLFKLSKIVYVFSIESLSQVSNWSSKWNFVIKNHEIKQVQFKQNFLQKMMDVGELIVISAKRERLYRFTNIGNFSKQKNKIEKILNLT